MYLGTESSRRLVEGLTTLCRSHAASPDFEAEFYRRHPRPTELLRRGLLWLPLLPVGLWLILRYLFEVRKLRRALELELTIARDGTILLTYPLMVRDEAFDDGRAAAVVLGSFNRKVTPDYLIRVGRKILELRAPEPGSEEEREVAALLEGGSHQPGRRRELPRSLSGEFRAAVFDLVVDGELLEAALLRQDTAEAPTFIPCVATPGESGHIRRLPESMVRQAEELVRVAASASQPKKEISSVPGDSERRWSRLGVAPSADGRWLAFDPGLWNPNQAPARADALPAGGLVLEGSPGPAWVDLELLRVSGSTERVSGVRLMFSIDPASARHKVGAVQVDTARMAIGPLTDVLSTWQVYGPLAECRLYSTAANGNGVESLAIAAKMLSSYGVRLAPRPSHRLAMRLSNGEADRARTALARAGMDRIVFRGRSIVAPDDEEIVQALEILRATGFPTESVIDEYLFVEPPSPEDLQLVQRLLEQATIDAAVKLVRQHTERELDRQMKRQPVGRVPAEGQPVLFAFPSGFASGSHTWYRLTDGDTVVGFQCELV